MLFLRPIVLWDEKTVLLIQQYRNNKQPYVNVSNNKIPFSSPSHSSLGWNYYLFIQPHIHAQHISFFLHTIPFSPSHFLFGMKENIFLIHNTPKKKSHKKLLIYKNNVFFIQFQFWMKLIPTQRSENKDHAWFVLLPFFSLCFIF